MSGADPGARYLCGRGIDKIPKSVRYVGQADDTQLRARLWPADKNRHNGGPRPQRGRWGLPGDAVGALIYEWRHQTLEVACVEAEGIAADGTARAYRPRPTDDDPEPKPAKRVTLGEIGGSAFVVRMPRGGKLHVCEGAIDALSLDALGWADPLDGVIAAHGCYELPKLAPWAKHNTDVRIYPHRLDKGDVGEVYADKLADLLAGRATVVKSKHDKPHDLNDELRGLAPRRREAGGGPEHPFQLLWEYQPVPRPEPILPGLMWHRMHSLIEAGPKWGKTTLLADVLACVYARGEWLDETCGTPGPILYMTEMDPGFLRAWIEGFLPDDCRPAIHVAPICKLSELGAAVKEVEPCGVIVDSFIDAFTHDPGKASADEWKASNVRAWHSRLKAVAPASIMTQHTRKSDGAGRDSGDLHAAVDMIIRMKDEDGKAYYDEPPAAMRGRELHYKGRWSEPVRKVTFDPTTGYSPTTPPAPKQPLIAHMPDGTTRVVPTRHAWLMNHLPEDGSPISRDELRGRVGTRPQKIRLSLDALIDAGFVVQSGAGTRGNSFRFARATPHVGNSVPETIPVSVPPNVHAGGTEMGNVSHLRDQETRDQETRDQEKPPDLIPQATAPAEPQRGASCDNHQEDQLMNDLPLDPLDEELRAAGLADLCDDPDPAPPIDTITPWLRETPGPPGNLGEHVEVADKILYFRRLTETEAEQERLRRDVLPVAIRRHVAAVGDPPPEDADRETWQAYAQAQHDAAKAAYQEVMSA